MSKKVIVIVFAVCGVAVGMFFSYEWFINVSIPTAMPTITFSTTPTPNPSSTLLPTPSTQIIIKQDQFIVSLNNDETNIPYRQAYPDLPNDYLTTGYPPIIIMHDDLAFVTTYMFPVGCSSAEDVACLEDLKRCIEEYKHYGGVWQLDLKNLTAKHIVPLPERNHSWIIKSMTTNLGDLVVVFQYDSHIQNDAKDDVVVRYPML